MINRRVAIQSTAAAAASLALPIVKAEEPQKPQNPQEVLWTFHDPSEPLAVSEKSIYFSTKVNPRYHNLLYAELDDCSIETIDDCVIKLSIGWHTQFAKLKLPLNDYQRLKDFVYQHSVKDRVGSYSYQNWGFNWVGKYKLWRNGKMDYEELVK